MSLHLKNPHSIEAVITTRPKDIIQLALPQKQNPYWKSIEQLARENKIKIANELSIEQKSRHSKHQKHSGRTQTFGALIKPKPQVDLTQLFKTSDQYGLWLALDTIQDPHNIGAIFRTAAFYNVKGILISENRTAPISETVYDVSAGGIEHVPYCIETNLKRALDKARESDIWILGTDENAVDTLDQTKLDRNWLITMGNEETGLRRLTKETCDQTVKIPNPGKINSLNVSVATAILLSHFN